MGEYINSRWFNVAAWSTTAVVTVLTGAYLWTQFH
jgi:Mn2+/Fe2+ NRAMP family transporter